MALTTFETGDWILQPDNSIIKYDVNKNIDLNGCLPIGPNIGVTLDHLLEYKLERDLEWLRETRKKSLEEAQGES